MFEWGCLPIINENDTVSVAEIRFGDNDHLAALVTNLLQAPLLVLLSVVDGLYSADPKTDPNAELVHSVPSIDAEILDHAGVSRSALGSGGMRSNSRRPAGDGGGRVGRHGQRRTNRRTRRHFPGGAGRHVVFAAQHHDAGLEALAGLRRPTCAAVSWWTPAPGRRCKRAGGSLLPIGVVQVVGTFGKGEVVSLCDGEGQEFARGLTNYSSTAADRLRGLRSEQIRETLGELPYEEVVHRDNLVVVV